MKYRITFPAAAFVMIAAALLFFAATGCTPQRNAEQEKHSAHEEHEHHEYEGDAARDQHDEADHDDHQGHDHGEDVVSLTQKALELTGIEIDTVRLGRISRSLEFPGEVGFNEDRLVHIAPRFGGVATRVLKKLGQRVLKDEELAVIESNESMSPYTLRSPMSGWIIEKHISTGEFVSEETSIYVIADLSDVWVNLAVYPKDARHIAPGQRVALEGVGNDLYAEGLISYIGHVYGADTRRLTARVELSNPNQDWKPGMFVKGTITVESGADRMVVARDAIQIVNQQPTVFIVKNKNEFEPAHIVTGESDEKVTEIVSGEIQPGDRYVARGAFDIKAHLVTGSLDAHAGHGH